MIKNLLTIIKIIKTHLQVTKSVCTLPRCFVIIIVRKNIRIFVQTKSFMFMRREKRSSKRKNFKRESLGRISRNRLWERMLTSIISLCVLILILIKGLIIKG